MKKIISKLNDIEHRLSKLAVSYEEYKKEHPNTKKTQSDPIFQTSSGKYIKNVSKNHKVHDSAMKSLGSKHNDLLITHDGKGSGTVHHSNGKSFSYDYDRGADGFFSQHGFHEEFSDMADAALKHLK
jgi:hypothetical protein